jgi:hypothetical protein
MAERRSGAYQCERCTTLVWTQLEPLRAGRSGKGRRCLLCGKNTLQDIGTLSATDNSALATVLRCSQCGTMALYPWRPGIKVAD